MSELIVIEERPAAGKKRSVQPGTTIGREGCDIVLPDPEVSRRHAVVRQIDSGLAIEDLQSTNGTYINGERVTGIRELGEGDGVRFGNTVWRVQRRGETARVQ